MKTTILLMDALLPPPLIAMRTHLRTPTARPERPGIVGEMDVTDPLDCASVEEWRSWLERHHASEDGAWLVISKKHATRPGVGLVPATEEALCFGWIDSAMRPIDEERYVLRFTPRRAKSNWSEVNKARVEGLIREGRMTGAGLAKVEEAKRDGRWGPDT